jgi:hypothetical protein
MYAFALAAFLISAGPAAASPQAAPPVMAAVPSDLAATLRVSDFAEIYIIPPWINFPVAPTPSTVRVSGCKFFVSRDAWNGDTAEWRELARALTGLEVEPVPAARRRQVYYGLVLGDRNGTIREIYTDHMDDPPGKVFALDERRQVHLPVRFATALFVFAARHPELAQGPPGHCPSRDKPWPPDYLDRDVSSNR